MFKAIGFYADSHFFADFLDFFWGGRQDSAGKFWIFDKSQDFGRLSKIVLGG